MVEERRPQDMTVVGESIVPAAFAYEVGSSRGEEEDSEDELEEEEEEEEEESDGSDEGEGRGLQQTVCHGVLTLCRCSWHCFLMLGSCLLRPRKLH